MKKYFALIFLLFFAALEGLSQELFYSNEHFHFYRQDEKEYEAYISAFSEAYHDLVTLLDLESNHSIKIIIFSNQRNFIEKIFGYYESKVTSVGMAVPGEGTIYITSCYDENTGRDFDEYMRVAKHELVHALLHHDKTWLSEGLALYCADQVREFDTLPVSEQEMSEYLDGNYIFKEAYPYYSWFSRYLIQKVGFNRYLQFYKSDYNWSIVGYSDQGEFCRDAFESLISSFEIE